MLHTATVIKYKNLTNDVFELFCKTKSDFNFEAGQFITIKIEDNVPPCFRAYSIASKPENSDTFRLCIKAVENGRGSNWLKSLKENDSFNFMGPNGKFTFKTSEEKKALFIAVGVGVAPFRSMIENQLLNKNSKQQMHLLFGLRYQEDIFYEDLFLDLSKKHSNFSFDLTLSRPEEKDVPGNVCSHKHEGRVTDFLKKADISPNQTEAYICGLKTMIEDVSKILKGKGLPKEAIHFEKYD